MSRDPISQQHLAEIRLKRLFKTNPEVRALAEENERLKALLTSHGIEPSATPRDPARGRHPDLPAEPEAASGDEPAAEWDAEAAQAPKKNAKSNKAK